MTEHMEPLIVGTGALVAVVAVGGAAFLGWRRDQVFKQQRTNWRQNDAMKKVPAWTSDWTEAIDAKYEATKAPCDELHDLAVLSQKAYNSSVAAIVVLVTFAFILVAVSAIWTLPREWKHAALFGEVLSFFIVVGLYVWSKKQGAKWLRARTRSELIRQFSVLLSILDASVPPTPEPPSKFRDVLARVDGGLSDPKIGLLRAVRDLWTERRQDSVRALEAGSLSVDAIVVYLRRRVVRQLHWFQQARSLLELREKSRERVLLAVFVSTVAALFLKVVAEFLQIDTAAKPLTVLLLTGTAVAGATTAYYVGQNQRSLLHRYDEQIEAIAAWLDTFVAKFSTTLQLSPLSVLPLSELQKSASAILEFEDLMIAELEDWIGISEHDTVELSA